MELFFRESCLKEKFQKGKKKKDMVAINSTRETPGRFANQFIRNMAVHFIARHHNLPIDYAEKEKMTALGVELFSGDGQYEQVYTVDDSNFFSLIGGAPLYKNIQLVHGTYAQTREFAMYLWDYFSTPTIQDQILQANQHRDRYQNNQDVFVHVRLGDVPHHNPGVKYYVEALQKAQSEHGFSGGYLSSDTPDHPFCLYLKQKYGLETWNGNEVETIQFANTCRILILSHGTFSWMMGLFGFHSQVYFPKVHAVWHGDIFVFEGWNEVEFQHLPDIDILSSH
jgi:hypothetical protein